MENQWLEPPYSCVFGFFQCAPKAYGDKSLKNIIYGGSGAFGNAA